MSLIKLYNKNRKIVVFRCLFVGNGAKGFCCLLLFHQPHLTRKQLLHHALFDVAGFVSTLFQCGNSGIYIHERVDDADGMHQENRTMGILKQDICFV